LTDQFILESFPTDDPIRTGVATYLASADGQHWISQVTKEEIIAICDRRAVLQAAGVQVRRCPQEGTALGAATEEVVEFIYRRAVEGKFRRHLREALKRLRESHRAHRPFDVFVFSHTHRADPGFTVPIGGDDTVRVVNTGAWQRVISPSALRALLKRDGVADADGLRYLTFNRLPDCYSFVRVTVEGSRAVPALKFWRRDAKGGRWGIKDHCDG
jgi:hypothetical protein